MGFRRFRQTVVEDGAGYVWQDDTDFELDHHLHHQLLPGRKGKSEKAAGGSKSRSGSAKPKSAAKSGDKPTGSNGGARKRKAKS